MKAAFSFNDDTLTGLVFGDLTIDYCKRLSDNVDVSQTGMTLTELGVGDYVIENPNATADTVCRFHVTADAGTRAVVMFSIFSSGGIGTGNTAVDHDTGGTDHLRYVTGGGAGIDNATICAYLKTDYDAGNIGSTYLQGETTTDVDGRWNTPLYLDSGFTYTIVFYKQGAYETATHEVTI